MDNTRDISDIKYFLANIADNTKKIIDILQEKNKMSLIKNEYTYRGHEFMVHSHYENGFFWADKDAVGETIYDTVEDCIKGYQENIDTYLHLSGRI